MSSSSGSSVSDSEENGNWDDWTEDPSAAQQAQSLFDDDKLFPSALQALEYDKKTHNVDLMLLASTLDFFERIRLINWIRATKPNPASLARLDRNAAWLQDDQYLKPVIEDDLLLQLDFDSLPLSSPSPLPSTSTSSAPAPSTTLTPNQDDLVMALKAQLADSNQALNELKKLFRDRVGLPDEVDVDEKEVREEVKGEKKRDDDTHYFDSYSYNEIHEVMLKDKVRTDSYRAFLQSNPSIFKDAVVLDVGCGTGILSMFAAQAGAKKVYAVDASAVAFKAERNIRVNGFSEVITVVKGKVEDIELPEKVDVIVSEWMGYFLLYECMLDSVLVARERFLKPTGLMVPSQCSILLSLFDGDYLIKERVQFWDNVYGFDMKCMKEEIGDEAVIDVVRKEDVVGEPVSLIDIPTQTVTIPELSFSTPFVLTSTRSTTLHAFLGHFDTFFTHDGRVVPGLEGEKGINLDGKKGEVFFSTGADVTPTHWKQTVFLLKDPIAVQDGTTLKGTFKCSKNPENSRELVVEIVWTVSHPGAKEGEGEVKAQVWKVR
ncbi:S-adenosyl-L-methionine-dependent methyltransferase [Meredithblackwellia eburnea MCA 4105]